MKQEEIYEYVKKQYGTIPEYLWKSSPESAILRHKNGKWYAAILRVEKSKLGLEEEGGGEMADKIALEDEKYAELESDLKKKHENILELLEKVIKDLQELTGKDGEFYTDAISPKVNLLCEELNDARASIEQVYSSHASIIASFKNAIADLDTCC